MVLSTTLISRRFYGIDSRSNSDFFPATLPNCFSTAMAALPATSILVVWSNSVPSLIITLGFPRWRQPFSLNVLCQYSSKAHTSAVWCTKEPFVWNASLAHIGRSEQLNKTIITWSSPKAGWVLKCRRILFYFWGVEMLIGWICSRDLFKTSWEGCTAHCHRRREKNVYVCAFIASVALLS